MNPLSNTSHHNQSNFGELEEHLITLNLLRNTELTLKDNLSLFNSALKFVGLPRRYSSVDSLTFKIYDQLVDYALMEEPSFNIKLFNAISIYDLGILGFAMMHSSDFEQALIWYISYHRFSSDYYIQRLKIDAKDVIFEIKILAPSASVLHKIEYTLAGVWRIIKTLIGDKINLKDAKIYFDYPEPDYIFEYEDYFDCECHFNQPKSRIVFPKSWLSLSSKYKENSSPNELFFQNLLNKTLGNITYSAKVRRLLSEHSGESLPNFQQAAESLRVPETRLRKNLLAEGNNYKKLLIEWRMDMAQHYLQSSSMPVKSISYLLGYSQQSAFDRAFKHFYGQTPIESRNQPLIN